MLGSSWIRYSLGPFLHFLSYYLKCHHSRNNHLVEPTEIQLTSSIPSISSHQIPPQLCPWTSMAKLSKSSPFWCPRSEIRGPSEVHPWGVVTSKRWTIQKARIPWWNCWMKQSPKFRWMYQSQTAWWLTYPSEKWWTSSVGMMTFPTEWQKNVPNHQAANSSQTMNYLLRLTPIARAQFCEYSNTIKNFQEFEECPTRKCMETSDVNVGLVSHH